MPAYPMPMPPSTLVDPAPQTAHFSAADFFRDTPWLNVPADRKANILIEPLYPRLGLLGGNPEAGGGKVSKLAALAAARKKESDNAPSPAPGSDAGGEKAPTPSSESKGAPLSLRERLARSGKPQRSSESSPSPGTSGAEPRLGSPLPKQKASPEPRRPSVPNEADAVKETPPGPASPPNEEPAVNIRAPPSTFASTIVGDAAGPSATELSHLHPNTLDLMAIYGQDLTEPFDFTGPSPDDVVLNAQSSAKGLAIRRKN